MNFRKLMVTVGLATSVMVSLTGCGEKVKATLDTPNIQQKNEYAQMSWKTNHIVVDETTGVIYYDSGTGITPLYNADGTLKNTADLKTVNKLKEDCVSDCTDTDPLKEKEEKEETKNSEYIVNAPELGPVVDKYSIGNGGGFFFSNDPEAYKDAYIDNGILHLTVASSGTERTYTLAKNVKFYAEFCDYSCRQGSDYCDNIIMELTAEDLLRLINEQPNFGGDMTHICFSWYDADNPNGEQDNLSRVMLVWHINTDYKK